MDDAERSGWPKDITTPEIIGKIHNIVLDDPKMKLRELSEAASTSVGSVVKIFLEDLGIRKLTTKLFIPILDCILFFESVKYQMKRKNLNLLHFTILRQFL